MPPKDHKPFLASEGHYVQMKGRLRGVTTLLLLESFKLILQEFQAIISLREVEKEPLKLNPSQTKHELSTRNKPGSELKKPLYETRTAQGFDDLENAKKSSLEKTAWGPGEQKS